MRILAYHVQPYEEKAFLKWSKENNIEVVLEKGLLTLDSVEKAKGFDGVTTQQVIPVKDEEIFKKLKEYGVGQISSRTAGVDMFGLDMAKEYGIAITNVPRYSPNAIAELAVSHAMHLLRNVKRIEKAMSVGDFSWNKDLISREIRSCTVGIVGTGRIGLTAGTLFKGLGANIIGYDKFRNPDADGVLEYKDTLEELLKEADIISLHLPLVDDTYHLINKDNIKIMKDDAIVVNTGRGALVNIDDIIEALESGKLAGAGLDVLECETLYVNQKVGLEKIKGTVVEKLMGMDNVVLTGHFAFFTETAVDNLVSISLDNIKKSIETGKLHNCTNM
ncbi:D-2-hydroxyacid dehydrogenase [Peptostreptococcus canis]|uniref:D-2-hydroxyacid dehydrogenase n=1 Tax=Peptostreptococcus canis TaxID=1159213 RepID=A0ABR6TI66_9FIRM|nr:D-2-hydroxyacid dehydrogenase [Peptostreptococcus canis]MBC2575105.1 D-2-hydroxyacid dehydrogenase [Peptostreptococcus canis]MBP1997721.1 D-lactate dehydrogenase [Peptostreptococcus canis]